MRHRKVAPLVLPASVVLCGCFDYGLPYPGDGTVDTASEPDVTDSQDVADPDTVFDPDVDPDIDDTGVDPDTVLDPDIDVDVDAPPAPAGFVAIAAGTFTMGSPGGEPGRDTDETEHSVTLTRAFEIMDTEVTQDEFFAVLGYRTSYFGSCGGGCPVEQVSWHEAAAYANALSDSAYLARCYTCTGSGTGVSCTPDTTYTTPYDCPGYRLPTEAEWEYAARAGTTDATYNGNSTLTDCTMPNTVLDPIAWFCGNSPSTTQAAGLKLPNAWGLYDMLGNVWEWCHDWYDGTYPGTVTDPWGPVSGSLRVMRGGSWYDYPKYARAAERYSWDPGYRDHHLGFRLARSLTTTPGFVATTAGTFTMGSPGGEPGRDSNEIEHSVTLTRAFEIMEMEVTQDEFYSVLGYRPSNFGSCGGSCPVEQVSWHEAAAYANALSASASLAECYTCTGSGTGVSCTPSTSYTTPYDCPGYRLPTEAEWEYAARAGTTDGTYNGTSTLTDCTVPNTVLDPIAWFCGNSAVSYAGCFDLTSAGGPSCAGTNPVGGKTPNAWGLYDMLGNVWEWCHDWYGAYPGTVTDPWGPVSGSLRVIRSGSWFYDAGCARAASRLRYDLPGYRNLDIGFRLARSLP